MNTFHFPFTAVVGQEDFKLALILTLIEPKLGGVLAVGDKGTGKTTLIRSLANLMGQEKPCAFVNLPLGASEDRVLGHINLERLINEKKEVIEKGLLAKADQGFLYVDEINLLNDYLMDTLLDASTSGNYHLEREGISKQLNSAFCLIGSMNPEEGDLRPQLKDRFGLSVKIKTIQDINQRKEVIKRRMQFDDHPENFVQQYQAKEQALFQKITTAQSLLSQLIFTDELLSYCAQLATAYQVEGLRADILLWKTARAYAAFENATEVSTKHIDAIADFVLNHRGTPPQNQTESDSPEQEPQNDHHSAQENSDDQNQTKNDSTDSATNSFVFQSVLPENDFPHHKQFGKSSKKGIDLKEITGSQTTKGKTDNKTIDRRKTAGQYLATDQFALHYQSKPTKSNKHLIFLLDSSGSMQKEQVIQFAKGSIQKWVEVHSAGKLQFSLVALFEDTPSLITAYTHQPEKLISALETIPTGGKTFISPAFKLIKGLLAEHPNTEHEMVLITDGRFQSETGDALSEAVTTFKSYCKAVHSFSIVDAEQGVVKLGQAKIFAERTQAKYIPLKTF